MIDSGVSTEEINVPVAEVVVGEIIVGALFVNLHVPDENHANLQAIRDDDLRVFAAILSDDLERRTTEEIHALPSSAQIIDEPCEDTDDYRCRRQIFARREEDNVEWPVLVERDYDWEMHTNVLVNPADQRAYGLILIHELNRRAFGNKNVSTEDLFSVHFLP